MNLAITYSRASMGIDALTVTVETHISNGLPSLHIVGLPETVVKESKDRVRSAILNSHFEFPTSRITINLAPADLPKYGGRYDLPIALGILAASKQIPSDLLDQYEFAGELALSGELRPIRGILPLVIGTRLAQKSLILPEQNVTEAELISGINLFPAKHLLDVCSHFLRKSLLPKHDTPTLAFTTPSSHDLSGVQGQHHAKRALEIAAAGQHSLLLIGPPGAGKTLISHCLPSILPPMSEQEAIELAAIQSIAGITVKVENWRHRPFRAPHHSASSYALIGGGNPPLPGEISLAHHGVLFLDELPEFKRQALEALREPLESGIISISRANAKIQYPARFQFIAAMNPCPCGQYGSPSSHCNCSPDQIKRYQSRVSGPLLDRIDIQIELNPVSSLLLTTSALEEQSSKVLQRVNAARDIQATRSIKSNASYGSPEIDSYCRVGHDEKLLLEQCIQQRQMSARSYHKILKLARTIADLEQETTIRSAHLKEAFSYRVFDKLKYR